MIQIEDKFFEEFLSEKKINSYVKALAQKIDHDFLNKDLLIIGVLNGAFMFLSDLVKSLNINPEISFVKFASYEGTSTTGRVNELIGLNEDLAGRHLLIVEDIVDTGNTLSHMMALLKDKGAESVSVATLFIKPEAFQPNLKVDYVGKEIANLFVVGYGMDYQGKGRNLTSLYQLKA